VRGVAVFPGDIIVGDANGAVCIPRHLGWDVAKAAAETEQLEEYVLERIRAGASLDGVYPPNSATMADYRAWRDARAAKA
jgi:regulator of RNase E activity RraA